MLRFALSLRGVMLVASIGVALGALLMFLEGGAKMVEAARAALGPHETKAVIALVMTGTDAFLFGIVLIIFAYAITFGFVFELSPATRQRVPLWMRLNNVDELKSALVAVILIYLVVDVATDWPATDVLSWQALIKPLSIFLIAAAFRLLPAGHSGERSSRIG
jgi:uncharacterized membrane protein YqhA